MLVLEFCDFIDSKGTGYLGDSWEIEESPCSPNIFNKLDRVSGGDFFESEFLPSIKSRVSIPNAHMSDLKLACDLSLASISGAR